MGVTWESLGTYPLIIGVFPVFLQLFMSQKPLSSSENTGMTAHWSSLFTPDLGLFCVEKGDRLPRKSCKKGDHFNKNHWILPNGTTLGDHLCQKGGPF